MMTAQMTLAALAKHVTRTVNPVIHLPKIHRASPHRIPPRTRRPPRPQILLPIHRAIRMQVIPALLILIRLPPIRLTLIQLSPIRGSPTQTSRINSSKNRESAHSL